MKNPINHRFLVPAIAVIVGIVASSRADDTAVSFNDSTIDVGTGGSGVYGWQFSTSVDIQVSSLGLYDYFKGDGLVAQHSVGIWDLSNPSQLLISATIPEGSSTPIAQDFRYVNVSPVILPAGQNYVIGALYQSDDNLVGSLNAPNWQLIVGDGLQFDGYRYGALGASTLNFPSGYIPGQQEAFGPNFTYTIVPEPSLWSLCVLGATAVSFSRRMFRSPRS